MNKIIFDGFVIYPLGEAKVSVSENVLRVEGITNTGCDGILISAEDVNNLIVTFKELPQLCNSGCVLKTTSLVRNELGHVLSLAETFKWYDAKTNAVIIGYTSSYMAYSAEFYGKIKGEPVFCIPLEELYEIKAFPIIAVAALVVAVASLSVQIWSELHTKTTTSETVHYDSEGRIVGRSVTTSEDPKPFEIELNNGKHYLVDEYGIAWSENTSEIKDFTLLGVVPFGEQITASGVTHFEITAIVKGA